MRRYDIDALRSILLCLLIIYHIMCFFYQSSGLLNSVTYEWLKYPLLFLNRWRIPLLFVISGMGTFFLISKRNGREFIKERFVRLFIPLMTTVIFITPIMGYILFLGNRFPLELFLDFLGLEQFSGNYFEFFILYMSIVIKTFPVISLWWSHLWFVGYLLCFLCMLTPLFYYLRNHPQAWIIRKTKSLAAHKIGLFALAIPLILYRVFLAPRFFSTNMVFWGDWFNVVNYGTLFFFGFLFMALKDTLWENVTKNRLLYLITAFISFAAALFLWEIVGSFPHKEKVTNTLQAIYTWTMILALIGYAATYLNKPSRLLSYANAAVFPIYILHSPVEHILSYYLKDVEMCFVLKFPMMVIGVFGISWLIYELGIRRYAWVRPLFGVKKKAELTSNK